MNDVNKPDVFGGFQALTESLLGGIPKVDDAADVKEVDSLDDILDDTDDDTDKKIDDVEEDEDIIEGNDSVEDLIRDTNKPKEKVKIKKPTDGRIIDDEDDNDDVDKDEGFISDEFEPDIAKFFQDKLAGELGWTFEEDEKFESVKELVDYMKDVVGEASKPVYANDEIEKLNEFVTNGGKLEDYYNTIKPGGIDVETLDTTLDADLKLAIREKLAVQGYKEERIKKLISRYEDSDILQEEGEDAVEFLKEYKEATKEKLLETTKKEAEQVQLQQQKFYSTVEGNIKSLEAIRGIKISSGDKKDLLDYIFKPDSKGVTKYQYDYMSDVKNLIESAYFTKEGDKLISSAKKTGTSNAYKDLHQKLKASKGKRHSGATNQSNSNSSDSLTNLLGKHLIGN